VQSLNYEHNAVGTRCTDNDLYMFNIVVLIRWLLISLMKKISSFQLQT